MSKQVPLGFPARMASLVIVLYLIFCSRAVHGAAPDLAAIKDKVNLHRSSIYSASLKFYFRPSAGQADNTIAIPLWTWKMKGDKRLLAVEYPQSAGGKGQRSNELYAFDGRNGYAVHYWAHDPALPKVVEKTSQMPERYFTEALPEHVLGWMFPFSQDSIVSLVNRPSARLVGVNDVVGVECPLIDLGAYLRVGVPLNEVRVWLDPSQEFLPRKLAIIPHRVMEAIKRDGPQPPAEPFALTPGESTQIITVQSFSRETDALTGESRSFPKTVELESGGRIIAEFTDVKINAQLRDEEFVPSIPAGVQLVERTASRLDPQVQISGGEAGVAIWKTAVTRENGDAATNLGGRDAKSSPVGAAVINARQLPFNYLYLGTVLLFAGLVIVYSATLVRRYVAR